MHVSSLTAVAIPILAAGLWAESAFPTPTVESPVPTGSGSLSDMKSTRVGPAQSRVRVPGRVGRAVARLSHENRL
jgi:hypothetical protein